MGVSQKTDVNKRHSLRYYFVNTSQEDGSEVRTQGMSNSGEMWND